MQSLRVFRRNYLLWWVVLLLLACCQTALADRSDVEAFVTRFYQQCMQREPDSAGLAYWTDHLISQTKNGSDVANGFIYSQEFLSRGIDNETYVTILYRAFFDREPDSGGFQYWLEKLIDGEDWGSVLNGFLGSLEFSNLCDRYGIVAYLTPVEAFVTRFYELCLNRAPDPDGLQYWVHSLRDGSKTGADVAEGFIFSQEFTNRNTSDDEFLAILYAAFFNREADPGGADYWMTQLKGLKPREVVLDGFIYAKEFSNLCAGYGIHPFRLKYDGTWIGLALTSTKYDGVNDPCGQAKIVLIVYNTRIDGLALNLWGKQYIISGSVNPEGTVSAGVTIGGGDTAVVTFDGTLSDNSGSGFWHTTEGCSGTWYITRGVSVALQQLVGTYRLSGFYVVFDDDSVYTENDFSSYSGTMTLRPDGRVTQTVTILGVKQTISATVSVVNSNTLRVSVSGYSCDLWFEFRQNSLITVMPFGPCGRDYSETDKWQKTSSSYSAAAGSIELEPWARDHALGAGIGAAIGNK